MNIKSIQYYFLRLKTKIPSLFSNDIEFGPNSRTSKVSLDKTSLPLNIFQDVQGFLSDSIFDTMAPRFLDVKIPIKTCPISEQ